MKIAAIIPARYGSTRFPGKPLANLAGKPIIAHVIDRAREASRVHEVLVATDDDRILEAAVQCGVEAIMTSPHCTTGSDRLAEVATARPDIDVIVNIQGDEPLMPPDVVDRAIEALVADPQCGLSTAMIRIEREADYLSPHVVKVVCDVAGRALYFSRSPIPNLVRATEPDKPTADYFGFKHFGLYVYRRETLMSFVNYKPTPLETMEKLEQLRMLENGIRIRVIEAQLDSIGIDTPEDLERASFEFSSRLGQIRRSP